MSKRITYLVPVAFVLTGALASPDLLAQDAETAEHRDDVVKVLANLGTRETVFDSISFGLSGPVVVLQGFTINGALRDDAKAQVQKLDWVIHVIQQVELLPVEPQVQKMREEILRILQKQVPQAFPAGFALIRIGVDGDGVVTLAGSIGPDDDERYKAAVEQIKHVTSVDSVKDNVVRQAS